MGGLTPSASGSRLGACTLLLGIAISSACARALPPPGGERDETPPGVLAITPEPLSTIAPTDEPVVIAFDERISERDVEDAVYVSPATGPVDIGKGRSDLEISVAGGWQPNRVYRVVVRPTLRDLFDNTLAAPIEIAFSTGAPFSDAALAGVVYERVTGTSVREARVEAHPADGGAYHLALSDTAGVFRMPLLPPGSYLLRAYADQNRDRQRDEYEVADSVMVEVGATDTVLRPLALMRPDSSAARLTRVQVVDSVTLRLSFDDYMEVSAPQVDASVQVRALPDSAIVSLAGIFYPHVFEVERARQDSIRADSIAAVAAAAAAADTTLADSLRADSLRADTTAAPSQGRRVAARPDAAAPDSAIADTMPVDPLTARVLAAELRPARDEPLPARELMVVLARPLTAEAEYVVHVAGILNLAGVPGGGGSMTFTAPTPPPPPPPPPPVEEVVPGEEAPGEDAAAEDVSAEGVRAEIPAEPTP